MRHYIQNLQKKIIMRTKIKVSLFVMLIPMIMLVSCRDYHRIEGNNHLVTENRNISGFEEVHLSDDFQVEIFRDSVFSVSVSAEENLIPYIVTEIGGSVLHISTKEHHNLKPHYQVKVIVRMPELSGVKLSGSGMIVCDTFNTQQIVTDISGSGTLWLGMHTNKIIADISGSGEMNFSGTANDADLTISGSGDIYALPLLTKNCTANISGSGNMYVSVSNSLGVHISGSGNVYYSGSPVVNANISGSGKVIKY
jgi:hypothetical protein